MYENLVEFLLGKKSELSDEEMNEFMELLSKAMDVTEEYQELEKQSIIENIINSVAVKDTNERAVISDAIESILMFNENSSESQDDEDLFVDRSEMTEPLKSRKVKRGRFNKSKESLIGDNTTPIEEQKDSQTIETDKCKRLKSTATIEEDPSQIFKIENVMNKNLPEFDFDIGELEENHSVGPSFNFQIEE